MSEVRREYIGISKDHHIVSVDTKSSHAITHLRKDASLKDLTREALERIVVADAPAGDLAFQVDLGRAVGVTHLVETYPNEPRTFGLRENRDLYAPFVERDSLPLVSTVVVILGHLALEELHTAWLDPKLLQQRSLQLPQCDLVSVFIGLKAPGLPGGDYEDERSKDFWNTHALVPGPEERIDTYDGIPPAYRP